MYTDRERHYQPLTWPEGEEDDVEKSDDDAAHLEPAHLAL